MPDKRPLTRKYKKELEKAQSESEQRELSQQFANPNFLCSTSIGGTNTAKDPSVTYNYTTTSDSEDESNFGVKTIQDSSSLCISLDEKTSLSDISDFILSVNMTEGDKTAQIGDTTQGGQITQRSMNNTLLDFRVKSLEKEIGTFESGRANLKRFLENAEDWYYALTNRDEQIVFMRSQRKLLKGEAYDVVPRDCVSFTESLLNNRYAELSFPNHY